MNPEPLSRLELHPAPFRARDGRVVAGAERGVLSVPMGRARVDGARLDLAFVRLPASGPRPGPPTVFLTGGPGLSAIRAAGGRLFGWFDALRGVGDVILLDQRGCGESRPALDCADAVRFAFDRAPTREEFLRETAASLRRCAERLAREGVDLAAFNTNESADDVADLIRTLYGEREFAMGNQPRAADAMGNQPRVADAMGNQPRVALLGWSYGTHLAMAVMKRHEALLARVVLAGPEGPDHTYKLPSRIQRQLEAVAARAHADPRWRERGPDLIAAMREVLDRAGREPVRVADLTVGRFDLEWIFAQGLADPRFVRRLPRWLSRMARGDFSFVAGDPLLRGSFEELRTGLGDSVLRYCMDCASGASAARRERIEREARETVLGRTIDFPFPEICDAVGNPDLGDAFRAPPRSSLPVLFVTGTLDCRTPAENVADLAPGLPNHLHVVAEDAGHGDLLLPKAVQRAVADFLRDGHVESERVRSDESFSFDSGMPVLLYDGACPFCRAQVDRMRRRTGEAVEYAAYQEARDRYPQLATGDLARAVHFVDVDGHTSRGAEAVFRALAAPRGRHPYLWMYRRIPGFRRITEWGYAWVARHRAGLGRVFR
jgi:pimeloyl-ACP methyl ester carboxylesterase/predicted DCC family thiol-disulfide oxidoreductase YuxK